MTEVSIASMNALELYIASRLFEGTAFFNSIGFNDDPSQPFWYWYVRLGDKIYTFNLICIECSYTLTISLGNWIRVTHPNIGNLAQLLARQSEFIAEQQAKESLTNEI